MTNPSKAVIAIHGGAGTISRSNPGSAAQEASYHEALNGILRAAQQLLSERGSALNAVSLAVDLLEDCPLFNAGYGAVFTHDADPQTEFATPCVQRVRLAVVCFL